MTFYSATTRSGWVIIAGILLCTHLQHLLGVLIRSLRVTTPKEKSSLSARLIVCCAFILFSVIVLLLRRWEWAIFSLSEHQIRVNLLGQNTPKGASMHFGCWFCGTNSKAIKLPSKPGLRWLWSGKLREILKEAFFVFPGWMGMRQA